MSWSVTEFLKSVDYDTNVSHDKAKIGAEKGKMTIKIVSLKLTFQVGLFKYLIKEALSFFVSVRGCTKLLSKQLYWSFG